MWQERHGVDDGSKLKPRSFTPSRVTRNRTRRVTHASSGAQTSERPFSQTEQTLTPITTPVLPNVSLPTDEKNKDEPIPTLEVAEPTAAELLEAIRTQYLEALYLSKV